MIGRPRVPRMSEPVGLATNCPVLLTVSVTLIVSGLFGVALPVAGFVPAIVMTPEQLVPAAIPAGAALTAMLLLVVPLTAAVPPLTISQLPQLVVEGVTV